MSFNFSVNLLAINWPHWLSGLYLLSFPVTRDFSLRWGINYCCQVTSGLLGISRVRNLSNLFGRLWIVCLPISFGLRGPYVSDKPSTLSIFYHCRRHIIYNIPNLVQSSWTHFCFAVSGFCQRWKMGSWKVLKSSFFEKMGNCQCITLFWNGWSQVRTRFSSFTFIM